MRKNKKDKKQDINYLDLIPETNQSIRWHRDLKQRIILEIENKGMFNTIAQKVFGKPRFSKVHLDEMGTFIKNMKSQFTVHPGEVTHYRELDNKFK